MSHKNSHELSIRPYWYTNSQLPPKAGCLRQRGHCRGDRNITLAEEDMMKEEIDTDHEWNISTSSELSSSLPNVLMEVTGELSRGNESIKQSYFCMIWNHENKAMEFTSSSVNKVPFENPTHMNSKNTGELLTEKRECEYCHKVFDSVRMNQKQNMTYQCETCYISSIITRERKNITKEHSKVDLKKDRWKCIYCNKSLGTKRSKIRHEMRHTKEKPQKCSYCVKSFTTISERRAHETTHTGVKPHKCKYCVKSFRLPAQKKTHEMIHTGEKPHQCSYCAKAFRTKAERKQHEMIHTDEKPHQCRYCVKVFRNTSARKRHEMTHTREKPHQCSYCVKTFKAIDDKKRHEMIHTGEKPHKCKYCVKSFSRLSYKKLHEMKHTGEKPHQCSSCVKAFRTKAEKKRHEMIHAGENLVM